MTEIDREIVTPITSNIDQNCDSLLQAKSIELASSITSKIGRD